MYSNKNLLYYIKLQQDDVLTFNLFDNGESPGDRLERLLVGPPNRFNGVLGGDNELDRTDVRRGLLNLGNEGGEVGPMLNEASKVPVEDVHVVEDDDLFSLIAVPPLVEGLDKGIGEGSEGGSGFTTA